MRWVALAAVVLVSVAVVDPRGEFPLNDDWLYARVVHRFLETGRLVRPWLASVSLVGPTLWGAAWCAIPGFSHTLLRCSGLALHGLACAALAAVVAKTQAPSRAVVAALALWWSPLAFVQAFSFMPEPFLEASVALALWALLVWEERPGRREGVFSAIALSTPVLAHPLGGLAAPWALARTLARGGGPRRWVVPAAATAAGALFLAWYLRGARGTVREMWLAQTWGPVLPWRVLTRIAPTLPTLGLCILPVGLGSWSWRTSWLPLCFAVWAFGVATWLGARPSLMLPTMENVIHQGGLGFLGLQGQAPSLPREWWAGLTLLGTLSALSFLGTLIPPGSLRGPLGLVLAALPWGGAALGLPLRGAMVVGTLTGLVWVAAARRTLSRVGPLSLAAAWVLGLWASPPFYDRYLVPLLPLVIAGMGVPRSRTVWIWVAALGVLTTIGTHDYMAWSRTRWRLVADLLDQGVRQDHLEAGYEWAGWWFAWEAPPDREGQEGPWWVRFWVVGLVPEYVVSLSPLPGHQVLRRVACPTITPGWEVLVSRRGTGWRDGP